MIPSDKNDVARRLSVGRSRSGHIEAGMAANTTDPSRLPQYQCHKVVRAAKIADVDHQTHVLLLDVDGERLVHPISAAVFEKHQPLVGGYWVIYPDGYESFSPAEPFESGYTRLPA